MQLSRRFKEYEIYCEVLTVGEDLTVNIYGGDIPHIGAVALGYRVQLPHDLNQMTSSVSLLTVPGHKEDEIVQKAAKLLSKALNKTVVVTCGIHVKNITSEEINEINDVIFSLVEDVKEIVQK